MAAEKSAGNVASTWLSACKPPADAASATTSMPARCFPDRVAGVPCVAVANSLRTRSMPTYVPYFRHGGTALGCPDVTYKCGAHSEPERTSAVNRPPASPLPTRAANAAEWKYAVSAAESGNT